MAVVFLGACAVLQLASESFASPAAVAGTFPTRIPMSFGFTVYRFVDALAPAPYVEATLATAALSSGDFGAAQHYAMRLPASTVRDELLGRIASARGNGQLAFEYFLAASDADAVGMQAQLRAAQDPAAGYALYALLAWRLERAGTHPDALAGARWQMGLLANREAWRQVPGSVRQRAWLRNALSAFDAAAVQAPLSERYAIADANQADLLGQRARAARLFARASAIDPGSADAVAGLGVIAWENRDRATAVAELRRARALDPQALMVRALERDLR